MKEQVFPILYSSSKNLIRRKLKAISKLIHHKS